MEGKLSKSKLFGILSAAAASTVILAGCDSNDVNPGEAKDLKGIHFQNPSHVEGYNNVNTQPNLVFICVHDTAFVTTSREAAGAVMRVERLDKYCPQDAGR